jgi:hypothetical protein
MFDYWMVFPLPGGSSDLVTGYPWLIIKWDYAMIIAQFY